jgi:hypothetical protein
MYISPTVQIHRVTLTIALASTNNNLNCFLLVRSEVINLYEITPFQGLQILILGVIIYQIFS